MFQSLEEDAELRISAFLVYVDTPTAETAITLKNLLDEEKSDQGTKMNNLNYIIIISNANAYIPIYH